jgi:hypothetical protein
MAIRTKSRSKIEVVNDKNEAKNNRNLDDFSIKLIKVVSVSGLIIGIVIIIAFWNWALRWLYKIW